MAQRATKFAKKTSRHVEVGALARAPSPADEMRAVPLEILPLVQPFKKRGRIAVRIEKLPIQARLSAGRNNGDRSYSLMLDELEDLEYLAPEGTEPRPVLSVRIISLDDGDASTIAVRELTVEFGEEKNYGELDLADISNEDLRRLIEELTRVKSTLSLREAELNEIRSKSASPSGHADGMLETKLAEARAAWKAEMDEKIAKVKAEAAANLEKSWAAWQAEQEQKARNNAAVNIEKERARWQQESLSALAKAEKEWKSAEAQRFAVAEAKWREHSEILVEKTRASSKAMREHGDAIELRRLRDELLAMQNLLAERDAELAQLRGAREKPVNAARSDIEAAVAKAQKEWKEAEAQRFAAAEAQWKAARERMEMETARLRDELAAASAKLAQSEKELAQAHAISKSGKEQGDSELRQLREETAALQVKLAAREKELAQAKSALRETEERAQLNGEAVLAKAEQNWKVRESERTSALQLQWQEKTAKALSEAHAQAKAELEKERQRLIAEADSAMAKAEAAWKARESDRLAAAEAQWQQKSAVTLAEARAQIQAARDQNEIELTRLRTELTIVQTKLAERDAALTDARATIERVREEAKTSLAEAEKNWRAEESAKLSAVEKRLREQAGSALNEAETARDEAENELRKLREHVAILETTLADRELELTQAIARINSTERQLEEMRENEDIQVRRVRGEVASLEAKLAEREDELAQARLFTERSYERWQKQAEAELAKAQKAWKSAEASRLAAARAEWQEEARKSLEQALEAERRAGRLPSMRPAEEAVSVDIAGIAEDRPMPVFAPPAQTAPALPPKPVFADARAAADQALDRLAMDAYQLLASPSTVDSVNPADTRIIKGGFIERRQSGTTGTLDKNTWIMAAAAAGIAAALAVLLLLIWPAPATEPETAPQPVVRAAVPIRPSPPAPEPNATVLRGMNVRAGPSTSTAVIASLKAGERILAGERQGSWVRVRVGGTNGEPVHEGWMFGSALQIQTAVPAEPAPQEDAAANKAAEVPAESEKPPALQSLKVEDAPPPKQVPAAEPAPTEEPQSSAPESPAASPAPAPTAEDPPATEPAAGEAETQNP